MPFVRRAPVGDTAVPKQPDGDVRRRFAPGSEWAYFRIYTGETLADTVLREAVASLVGDLVGHGADSWFFIRYADPEPHLRVRFKGDPEALRSKVRPRVEAVVRQLLDDGLVWRLEVGTYQREVARYGGAHAIEAAESLFAADSDAVLALLSRLEAGDAGQQERWRLGLVGVHHLLLDLGLDEHQRLELVRRQRDGLARRLRWDRTALARVGRRFREEQQELVSVLAAEPESGHPLASGLEVLRERSTRSEAAAAVYAELERAGRLVQPRSVLAGAFLHMHLNRLLRGDSSAQELMICDFLGRLYATTTLRRAVSRRP